MWLKRIWRLQTKVRSLLVEHRMKLRRNQRHLVLREFRSSPGGKSWGMAHREREGPEKNVPVETRKRGPEAEKQEEFTEKLSQGRREQQ